MTTEHTWISWVSTLLIYVVGLTLISWLVKKEMDKRSNLTVLSWNGKISDLPAHATTRTRGSTTNKNSNSEYIEGSIHYLSYSIYFFCLMFCIFNIFRFIPALCPFYVIHCWTFCLLAIKMFIQLLQLQRFMLCFVKIKVAQQEIYHDLTRIMFISCFVIVIFGNCAMAFSYLLNVRTFVLENIWCYFTYVKQSNIWFIDQLQIILIVLGVDWIILGAYTIKIWQLSTKIQKPIIIARNSNNSNNNNNVNIDTNRLSVVAGIRSTSTIATQASRVSSNNNNVIKLQQASKNVRKLRDILARILVCSIVMELTFVPGLLLSFYFGFGYQDTLWLILIHFCLVIDAAANVGFVSLMLQHNTKDYIELIKKFPCLVDCINSVSSMLVSCCKTDHNRGGNGNENWSDAKTLTNKKMMQTTTTATTRNANDGKQRKMQNEATLSDENARVGNGNNNIGFNDDNDDNDDDSWDSTLKVSKEGSNFGLKSVMFHSKASNQDTLQTPPV